MREGEDADRYYDIFETPLGWMGALTSSKGLRRTTLPQLSPDRCLAHLGPEADGAAIDPDRLGQLRGTLRRYFGGGGVTFRDEPIDIEDATPFLRAAWSACSSIPFGETRSYKWLAAEAGRPRALRAAGQSMARNRLPIIVPCHRVIGSDGGLGGYGRGVSQLRLKQRLLELEAAHSSQVYK